jgi:hypothetical protein
MKSGVIVAGSFLLAMGNVWAAAASPPTVVSGRDKAKLAELQDILRSRNDNDLRLDHDFNDLSPAAKRLFRNKYAEIAPEKRNERGTIVYLLGKNLKVPEDWAFLKQVALEPPCLSLSDCSKKPALGSDEEATGDEVTLAYPSLVALRQARLAAQESHRVAASAQGAATTAAEKTARALFAAAKGSKTRAVARMAASYDPSMNLNSSEEGFDAKSRQNLRGKNSILQ